MKKRIPVLLVIIGSLVGAGCASQQTEITRQDLAEAQATITTAKMLGAQTVAPDEIARAEHNYKLALDDFNRAPKGRLGAFHSEKKVLETSASEKARQARRQAESALFKIKSQERHAAEADAALRQEADALKSQVARLEREQAAYRQEQAAATLEFQRAKERRLPVNTAGIPDCTTTSEALYNKAFYLFQTRHYDQARKAFEQHRQLHTDQLSDNAQFWIGECYFMQQDYEQAHTAFQQLLTDFPQSNKIADTLLSVGLCLNRLNQREGAVQKWIMVVEKYPDSTAAAYAQKFLASK